METREAQITVKLDTSDVSKIGTPKKPGEKPEDRREEPQKPSGGRAAPRQPGDEGETPSGLAGAAELGKRTYGALTSSGLSEKAMALGSTIPFVGSGLRAADLASEYGTAVASGLFGKDAAPTEAVRAVADKYDEIRARLDAVGETGGMLRDIAVTQAVLGKGVDVDELRRLAPLIYAATEEQDLGRRTVRRIGRDAAGAAIGEQVRDALGAALTFGAGR